MKIAIGADSVLDLTQELIQKNDIKILQLRILLGDEEYYANELINQKIFDTVNQTGVLPKTSAPNVEYIENFFEEVLKENDGLIFLDISSEMSSSYNNAVIAAQKFEGKVEVIDSRTLSSGMSLLALYAKELTKTESDIKIIADKVRARVDAVQASFVVERLDFLYKGGRCSSLELLGANILKIRPQILVKDGKMKSYKKYRGALPMVISRYCKETLEEFNTPDKSMVFLTYSSATPEMVKAARDVLEENGFENIYETTAGCIVTSHCGENTLGILYFNDGQKI